MGTAVADRPAPVESPGEPTYTVLQVAKLLGCGEATVRSGVLPIRVYRTPGGHRRLSRADAERYRDVLAEKRREGAPPDRFSRFDQPRGFASRPTAPK